MKREQAALLTEIEQRIASLREQLRAQYGWTHLDLRASVEPGRVRVTGTVAVRSLVARVRERIEPLLAPEQALELALEPMPTLAWYALPEPVVELWAEHPSRARSLATELLRDDGPIGLLADAQPGLLVRARDGTVAWMLGDRDSLGELVPARPLTAPTLPEQPDLALVTAALARLGVAYVLGGNSPARIDCSGLIARSYADALGITLPRHSNDQRAVVASAELIEHADGEAGDLLFVRSRSLGRSHVAMATGRNTVVHASRSQNRVIEESTREFERDAEWIRRVRWQAIVDWSRTQVGRPHIELP